MPPVHSLKQLDQYQVLEMLQNAGAFLEGHFQLSSGRHSNTYINKNALFVNPDTISFLCEALAGKFATHTIEVVVGPATGGIILSQWVAFHLSRITGNQVLAVYGEKNSDANFYFARGYPEVLVEKNALIVEDIVTTGNTINKVYELLKRSNANVVGVGCLVNRSGRENPSAIPNFYALLTHYITKYHQRDCPQCKAKEPISS